MKLDVDVERLNQAFDTIQDKLLSERNSHGTWAGELSTSALSTATAVMALQQVVLKSSDSISELQPYIANGLRWLAEHQNADGGWGDTTKSYSNISTTMLAHAVFHATNQVEENRDVVDRAASYIDKIGGVEAVVRRYGRDKTFSVPILTHCALAGLADWKDVTPLPFEMACLPHRFYATIRLPVVSYALPALIAIGQVRHHFRKSWNPIVNWIRDSAIDRSLKVLTRIQPQSGGFLEATPLTSFVTMSLAAKGLVNHPVVKKGVEFIRNSVLADGSWPIDTNLATWVTTLSVNALKDTLPEEEREVISRWLLDQQYKDVHPYTNADPGGWAWTDLSGGVPDADDTPGAMLALLQLNPTPTDEVRNSLKNATKWLLDLQNRDGGWPTFCRGWGTLPFDRSSPDITAHCLRALFAVREITHQAKEIDAAIRDGFDFLDKRQNEDGSWLPLWFGNQDAPDEINPLYGTSKVVLAYVATGRTDALQAQAGLRWLKKSQNTDGGWGGVPGAPSSVEETALAVETLLTNQDAVAEVSSGLNWLMERIEDHRISETSPIGFYFAKLWYFERLYPLIFATSAIRKADRTCQQPV